MHLLDNTLRPYAWGSEHAIAELLGREESGGPEAELWVGAHPDSPSTVLHPDGSSRGLDELIGEDPEGLLGPEVARRFDNRLPFLLKVLAADSALSLQVHPSLDQAAAGFDAEEADAVPQDAPHRKYRDRNHKPEMIYALTPFEALCGFRPVAEAAATFAELSDAVEPGSEIHGILDTVAARLTAGGSTALRSAFEELLAAPSQAVEKVTAAIEERRSHAAPSQDQATVVELNKQYPGDPGVLIALLLNRISLRPGEALYLPAGNIHAYLRGLGIEVMASSDNVLRGGLTPKHVDTAELLATVVFEPATAPALAPEYTLLDQELYRPPFDEFQLQRILLEDGSAGRRGTHSESADDSALDASSVDAPSPSGGSATPAHVAVMQNGPVIVLAVSGPILLDTPNATLSVPRGGSAFVGASEAPLVVRPAADEHGATDGPVLAFAVTVGGVPTL
jgi:mannose-6-phosphate isomerase